MLMIISNVRLGAIELLPNQSTGQEMQITSIFLVLSGMISCQVMPEMTFFTDLREMTKYSEEMVLIEFSAMLVTIRSTLKIQTELVILIYLRNSPQVAQEMTNCTETMQMTTLNTSSEVLATT